MPPIKYTRELLADAAGSSESLSAMLRTLGTTPTNGSRRYLRKLMNSWGIDYSHFEREGVRHTERRLRELVRKSSSMVEVVRHLGISPVGGNQTHIARRVAALGIDTSHFAQPRPQGPKRSLDDRLVLGTPEDGRLASARLKKYLIRAGESEECALCGTGTVWNGSPLRLEVDHTNGKWWDNRPENLRLLCPNCHATTDTFRGRKRDEAGQ